METMTVKNAPIHVSAGDAAVDGLSGGLVAGLVMAAFLSLAGLMRGEGIATLLGRFAFQSAITPLAGLLLHLAVSSIYGIAYGLGFRMLPRKLVATKAAWVALGAGVTYGLALWLLANYVLLPVSASPLREIPALTFVLAHLVYGGALGWSVYRIAMRRARLA